MDIQLKDKEPVQIAKTNSFTIDSLKHANESCSLFSILNKAQQKTSSKQVELGGTSSGFPEF